MKIIKRTIDLRETATSLICMTPFAAEALLLAVLDIRLGIYCWLATSALLMCVAAWRALDLLHPEEGEQTDFLHSLGVFGLWYSISGFFDVAMPLQGLFLDQWLAEYFGAVSFFVMIASSTRKQISPEYVVCKFNHLKGTTQVHIEHYTQGLPFTRTCAFGRNGVVENLDMTLAAVDHGGVEVTIEIKGLKIHYEWQQCQFIGQVRRNFLKETIMRAIAPELDTGLRLKEPRGISGTPIAKDDQDMLAKILARSIASVGIIRVTEVEFRGVAKVL